MIKKTFDTNYNGKLACQKFLHIDKAPAQGIPESKLAALEVEISTADGSHPPVKAKVVDIARVPLYLLSNILTWQSHGIVAAELISQQEKLGMEATQPMAVYLYQKLPS